MINLIYLALGIVVQIGISAYTYRKYGEKDTLGLLMVMADRSPWTRWVNAHVFGCEYHKVYRAKMAERLRLRKANKVDMTTGSK